jgi:acetyltransferase-like isoleucine patch superfamily enzyme
MLEGKNCRIGNNLRVLGKGQLVLKNNVTIGDNVTINVSEKLTIGDRSTIGNDFIIEGRDIELGSEFWSGHHCQIGGGSCFEKTSLLRAGYWCHLGNFSLINTARPVQIGNEVGMGTDTKIYTHGAYLSLLDGFPVDFGPITIGDNVWLPGATVLPNVNIGNNVVVAVGSVVTKDIPSGCLAAGVPAKILKEQCYPKIYTAEEKKSLVDRFITHFKDDIVGIQVELRYDEKSDILHFSHAGSSATEFHMSEKHIHGNASSLTESLRNELRRYGVRFKSYPQDEKYVQW